MRDPPVEAAQPLECVLALRCLVLEQRLAEIQKGLADASDETLETLLHEKLTLRRQMANL